MARRRQAAAGATTPADGLCWVPAGGGYSVALDGAELCFCNPRGKLLEAVPAHVRASSAAEQLGALVGRLADHASHALVEAERLMLLERTLTAAELGSLWRDPAWRAALSGVAVLIEAPADPLWTPRSRHLLLLAASPDGLVEGLDLDGELARFAAKSVAIPHPLRLEAELLATLRAIAGRAGVHQAFEQLERARPRLAPATDLASTRVEGLFGAVRLTWRGVEARCRALGVRLRSGYASLSTREDGIHVESRLWLGRRQSDRGAEIAPAPGELCWIDQQGEPIPVGQVGPIAMSEGLRLADEIRALSGARRARASR